ncbi:hypothetical protein E4T39_03738 [Aureobasidium subglaciale]|nr:hypothetical protein E4T39_03738 [Aureobasidium subglaciale]
MDIRLLFTHRHKVKEVQNDHKHTVKRKALVANIALSSSETYGCHGFTGSVPRLAMCSNDAESGVRTASKVDGYPARLHVGASWNRSLAYDRTYCIGQDVKMGLNVLLGPGAGRVAGPLGRITTGRRNWEGFSNDSCLAGTLYRAYH